MKRPKTNTKFSNRRPAKKEKMSFGEEDMDDEIDAFHKQRDIIPLDGNDDTDEDEEHPVYDFEGLNEDTDDTDGADSEDEELVARQDKNHEKMVKQQKILQKKFGAAEEDLSDDSDGEETRKASFGRGRQFLYGADNIDFEIQSDEENLAEEEAIAVMSQKEKAKSLSTEDFGLEDVDEEDGLQDDEEQNLQTVFAGKRKSNKSDISGLFKDEAFESHEEIKKDINALTKEEQMEIVYSSAPELVGLLSELNETLEQFYALKPLLVKARNMKGLNYFETKQGLLLSYLQAISFYLLLKSEGNPVRGHPVIAHLVELKKLQEKMKNVDSNISSLVGENYNDNNMKVSAIKSEDEKHKPDSDSDAPADNAQSFEVTGIRELKENGVSICECDPSPIPKEGNQNIKLKNVHVGRQSLQMLKVRELLEQKLKEKGIFNSVNINSVNNNNAGSKTANRQTGNLMDFEDDAGELGTSLKKNIKFNVHVPPKTKATKLASGDDDLPKRENIGEKRRKYDLRAISDSADDPKMDDDDDDDDDDADEDADNKAEPAEEAEDEFYKQVKKQRLTKLSAKAALYSRNPHDSVTVETEADGKRQITYQMEKNKGLTRHRKKLTKIPRKKYKLKHAKAVVRRKGQVRDIRKPAGPYGGEASGINTRVSRSIRL